RTISQPPNRAYRFVTISVAPTSSTIAEIMTQNGRNGIAAGIQRTYWPRLVKWVIPDRKKMSVNSTRPATAMAGETTTPSFAWVDAIENAPAPSTVSLLQERPSLLNPPQPLANRHNQVRGRVRRVCSIAAV